MGKQPEGTGANFVQNQTTQQAGSSFNSSGNGTAGGELHRNTGPPFADRTNAANYVEWYDQAGVAGLYSSVGGASRLSVTTGGNVGIGTDAPATRLDVNGNLRPAVRLCPVDAGSYTLMAADIAFRVFRMVTGNQANNITLPPAGTGQAAGQYLTIINRAIKLTNSQGTTTDNTSGIALPASNGAGIHAVKYIWAGDVWVRVQ